MWTNEATIGVDITDRSVTGPNRTSDCSLNATDAATYAARSRRGQPREGRQVGMEGAVRRPPKSFSGYSCSCQKDLGAGRHARARKGRSATRCRVNTLPSQHYWWTRRPPFRRAHRTCVRTPGGPGKRIRDGRCRHAAGHHIEARCCIRLRRLRPGNLHHRTAARYPAAVESRGSTTKSPLDFGGIRVGGASAGTTPACKQIAAAVAFRWCRPLPAAPGKAPGSSCPPRRQR